MTSSAPSSASSASCPAYRTGAKPSRSPLARIPPASLTATTLVPNSGVAYSDTSWPCWAKSNADATPPLPAPRTATRIPNLPEVSRSAYEDELRRRVRQRRRRVVEVHHGAGDERRVQPPGLYQREHLGDDRARVHAARMERAPARVHLQQRQRRLGLKVDRDARAEPVGRGR